MADPFLRKLMDDAQKETGPVNDLAAQQVAKDLEIGMLGRSHMQISARELRILLAERRELLARQVPETPTEEMITAFSEAAIPGAWKKCSDAQKVEARIGITKSYKAMLAAAPKADKTKEGC